MNLWDQRTVRQVMTMFGLSFRKEFGQNFLTDPEVIDATADACSPTEDCTVLEIGPGIGTLTRSLAARYKRVIALEVDRSLIPVLRYTLEDCPNVTVVNEDVMQTDLPALLAEAFAAGSVAVCANLPYYITTPIIMGLFESHAPIQSITVMVQKEVADRMQSGPGTKDYGALSLAVQYYAEPDIIQEVPPHCFIPRPNVGSAVIRLKRYAEPPVQVEDERWMFQIIKAAFGQRRKTLLNALSSLASIPKDATREALASLGLSETIRGEALTLAQFAALADALSDFQST